MELSYIKNGETLALDSESCSGCGACVDVCPHAVFRIEGGRARVAGRGYCMECGACARNCPAGAVTVRAGVGCAAAIIAGKLRGTDPSCGPECGCPGTKGCC